MTTRVSTLDLHQRIYDFILYITPILARLPQTERFTSLATIREALNIMLVEVIRFEKSGFKPSHLYNIDCQLVILQDMFKMLRDRKVSEMGNKRVEHITKLLEEIGRILGGLIKAKLDKTHKNGAYTDINSPEYRVRHGISVLDKAKLIEKDLSKVGSVVKPFYYDKSMIPIDPRLRQPNKKYKLPVKKSQINDDSPPVYEPRSFFDKDPRDNGTMDRDKIRFLAKPFTFDPDFANKNNKNNLSTNWNNKNTKEDVPF